MRELFQKLIAKMLRREVWGYWYLTSQSGIKVDPDLKEMRKPWADPVIRENIMYSGHLLLMISLYEMLFDSDEYEKEGSITFVSSRDAKILQELLPIVDLKHLLTFVPSLRAELGSYLLEVRTGEVRVLTKEHTGCHSQRDGEE